MPKYQLQNFLKHRNLPDSTINLLFNLLQSEIEFGKAVNQFQMITKKKTEAGNLAKQALQELGTVVQNAELYGVEVRCEKDHMKCMTMNDSSYL